MSTAHTPGPWLHDTRGFPAPDVRAASGRAVARTWMVCRSQPKTEAVYQARCEEDRANARLIAAAPDLLAALLRCRFDSLNMTLADLEFCRAAIAKATGVQP